MSVKNENRFIYAVKFIACLFVITIHAPFPGKFGDVVGAASRFAVPFFFAVGGRFLLTNGQDLTLTDVGDIRKRTRIRLKRLLKVTAVVYLVYLCFSFFFYLSIGESLKEWFSGKYNLTEFMNLVLFNSGRFIFDASYNYDHMWYLFALIYVYLLIMIFAPVLRKWYKGLIVLLLGLLYFGEALQTWYPVKLFGIGISTWYVLRNWLFVGIPFVLIGVLFSDYVCQKRNELGKEAYEKYASRFFRPAVFTTVFGFILSTVERFVIDSKEVYIGSLIVVVGLLFLSEAISFRGGALYILGKRASSNIYYYHVLVIAILDYLSSRGYVFQYNQWQKPIIVIILCILIFGGRPIFDLLKGLKNEQN